MVSAALQKQKFNLLLSTDEHIGRASPEIIAVVQNLMKLPSYSRMPPPFPSLSYVPLKATETGEDTDD
jgi:hypothetical protein